MSLPFVGHVPAGQRVNWSEDLERLHQYNRFWGSLVIGLNGLVGFSRYPLDLISLLRIVLAGFAFTLAVVYLGLKLGDVAFPAGNPTIVIVVSLFSAIQLLSLGAMEYVGSANDESRNRPKHILESRYGWDDDADA